jgi:arsenate reductase-like glutaredoxin family protein
MAVQQQSVTGSGMNQGDLVALLTNMATAINALIANHNTLVAKLNADAGVTDTNYAVSTASTVSLTV